MMRRMWRWLLAGGLLAAVLAVLRLVSGGRRRERLSRARDDLAQAEEAEAGSAAVVEAERAELDRLTADREHLEEVIDREDQTLAAADDDPRAVFDQLRREHHAVDVDVRGPGGDPED